MFFVVLAKREFFEECFLRCLVFCPPIRIFAQNVCAMTYVLKQLYREPCNCLFCGEPIPEGRPDKKFCSSVCKNRWHNRKNSSPRDKVQVRIIRILERNYDILDRLVNLGIKQLDILILINMGFNVNYGTSYRKSGIHDRYACFDISYELTPSRIKKIVRNPMETGADFNNPWKKPESKRLPEPSFALSADP